MEAGGTVRFSVLQRNAINSESQTFMFLRVRTKKLSDISINGNTL